MKMKARASCANMMAIFVSVSPILPTPVPAGESGNLDEDHDRDSISEWVAGSPDLRTLGSRQIQWPDVVEIESFFPLGFSDDGWFAYSNRIQGLLLDAPLGICHDDVPCFDVSLFNVLCDDPCAGDVDPSAGPQCRCLRGVSVFDLKELGVRPLQDVQFGEFPASFGGIEYDVETTFREKALLSRIRREPRKAEFPETRVSLLAGDRERRQIAAIDHNQSGVGTDVRIAGWLKHPDLNRIIVLLLAQRRWSGAFGAAPYYLLPIAVEIGE